MTANQTESPSIPSDLKMLSNLFARCRGQNLELTKVSAQGECAVIELEAARYAVLVEVERKRIFRRGVAGGFVEVGDHDRPAAYSAQRRSGLRVLIGLRRFLSDHRHGRKDF